MDGCNWGGPDRAVPEQQQQQLRSSPPRRVLANRTWRTPLIEGYWVVIKNLGCTPASKLRCAIAFVIPRHRRMGSSGRPSLRMVEWFSLVTVTSPRPGPDESDNVHITYLLRTPLPDPVRRIDGGARPLATYLPNYLTTAGDTHFSVAVLANRRLNANPVDASTLLEYQHRWSVGSFGIISSLMGCTSTDLDVFAQLLIARQVLHSPERGASLTNYIERRATNGHSGLDE
ncbi:hypothetical protein C8R46DRAFT_1028593 [Mycena filopes]|nr:hypothetical protein C8R46DRAFT_1028593 [Mycena filopes]